MRIYTEVSCKWDDKQGKLVETSSKFYNANLDPMKGEIALCARTTTRLYWDLEGFEYKHTYRVSGKYKWNKRADGSKLYVKKGGTWVDTGLEKEREHAGISEHEEWGKDQVKARSSNGELYTDAETSRSEFKSVYGFVQSANPRQNKDFVESMTTDQQAAIKAGKGYTGDQPDWAEATGDLPAGGAYEEEIYEPEDVKEIQTLIEEFREIMNPGEADPDAYETMLLDAIKELGKDKEEVKDAFTDFDEGIGELWDTFVFNRQGLIDQYGGDLPLDEEGNLVTDDEGKISTHDLGSDIEAAVIGYNDVIGSLKDQLVLDEAGHRFEYGDYFVDENADGIWNEGEPYGTRWTDDGDNIVEAGELSGGGAEYYKGSKIEKAELDYDERLGILQTERDQKMRNLQDDYGDFFVDDNGNQMYDPGEEFGAEWNDANNNFVIDPGELSGGGAEYNAGVIGGKAISDYTADIEQIETEYKTDFEALFGTQAAIDEGLYEGEAAPAEDDYLEGSYDKEKRLAGEAKEKGLETEITTREGAEQALRTEAVANIRAAEAAEASRGFATSGVGYTAREALAKEIGRESREIKDIYREGKEEYEKDYLENIQFAEEAKTMEEERFKLARESGKDVALGLRDTLLGSYQTKLKTQAEAAEEDYMGPAGERSLAAARERALATAANERKAKGGAIYGGHDIDVGIKAADVFEAEAGAKTELGRQVPVLEKQLELDISGTGGKEDIWEKATKTYYERLGDFQKIGSEVMDAPFHVKYSKGGEDIAGLAGSQLGILAADIEDRFGRFNVEDEDWNPFQSIGSPWARGGFSDIEDALGRWSHGQGSTIDFAPLFQDTLESKKFDPTFQAVNRKEGMSMSPLWQVGSPLLRPWESGRGGAMAQGAIDIDPLWGTF